MDRLKYIGLGSFVVLTVAVVAITSHKPSKTHQNDHKDNDSADISTNKSVGKDRHPTSMSKVDGIDPLAMLESKIVENEISPVVQRLERNTSLKFQSLVIGIAGGSGSGKTTLSRAVVDALGRENIAYISHDSYYKDLSHLPISEREKTNFDHPDSLDTDLLTSHVKKLKAKQSTHIPVYDFATHSRTRETELLHPRPIILVEGILIFGYQQLTDMMDIKIFVDTDDDIRLIRRMERDVVERGRSVQHIISQYLQTVRPMHLQYVQPSKKNADIIVPQGLNSVALDLVISKLKRVLADAESLKTPGSKAGSVKPQFFATLPEVTEGDEESDLSGKN